MTKIKPFKPSWPLKNRHIQTVYASLFRSPKKPKVTIEQFDLNDGDFVEAYWHTIENAPNNTPVVILFHGLAGSFHSPYIQGMMQACYKAGFHSVVMHFRGCSGKPNKKARSYHSGDTADARAFSTAVKQRYKEAPLFGVGYSLGANMLVKLFGEDGEDLLFDAGVAVSAPLLLDRCANQMQRGFSRFYQHLLIKDLQKALDQKYDDHPMEQLLDLPRHKVKKLKTFWQFDAAYTAKINGFASALDYYTRCSAKPYLKNIQKPLLIIHAKDDPFMTHEIIPHHTEVSDAVVLEILENGGHVGFVNGSLFKPEYWLEERIVAFFKDYLFLRE